MFKEKLLALKNEWDKFLFSDLFITFVAGVILFFHVIGNPHPGILFLLSICVYVMLTQKDLLPLVPILLMICYILPQDFESRPFTEYLYLAYVLPVPIIGSAVFFFLKNKPKFLKSRNLIPCIVFCVALVFSGAFTKYYFLTTNILMILQMLAVYLVSGVFFFTATNKLDFPYMARCMVNAGVMISIQLAIFYLKNEQKIDDIIQYKMITLGWGISNNIGITLGICMPAAFYLATKSKYSYLYVITAFVMYTANLFTLCRGSIFICTGLMPFMLGTLILITPKGEKLKTTAALLGCLVLALAFMYMFKKEINIVLDRLAQNGLNDNGRYDIWKHALEVYMDNPVFGVGYAYDESFFALMYAVHNTILQFLASGGAIGFLTALYFFMCRYRTFLPLKKRYFFFIAAVIIYESYGLIDLTPYLPYLSFMVSLIFITVEKDTLKSKEELREADSVANDEAKIASAL